MADRKYYVLCESNCKFESMTKEQIIAAIAEATGNTPTDIDGAFITKIKEQNKNTDMRIWVGSVAEYNAIVAKGEKDVNTIYCLKTPDGDNVLNYGVGIKSIEQTYTSYETYGENVITVTLTSGVQTQFVIRNGGKGDVPVKGIDYWTQADKNEIVADVLSSLPNANGVTF